MGRARSIASGSPMSDDLNARLVSAETSFRALQSVRQQLEACLHASPCALPEDAWQQAVARVIESYAAAREAQENLRVFARLHRLDPRVRSAIADADRSLTDAFAPLVFAILSGRGHPDGRTWLADSSPTMATLDGLSGTVDEVAARLAADAMRESRNDVLFNGLFVLLACAVAGRLSEDRRRVRPRHERRSGPAGHGQGDSRSRQGHGHRDNRRVCRERGRAPSARGTRCRLRSGSGGRRTAAVVALPAAVLGRCRRPSAAPRGQGALRHRRAWHESCSRSARGRRSVR